jgi:cytochrome c-type biogenesis protein CcmH/NrfG
MRKIIIVAVTCVVVLLLGYTGYRGYKVWREKHWLALAKQFAAKADINNEVLSLQQVLRLNPQNADACRLMANVCDVLQQPMALDFRQRVVQLQPHSLNDRLALAQTAMFFGDLSLATNAMAGASGADQKTADYQNLAGLLAGALGNADEAKKHFTEAMQLDPNLPAPQINYAFVLLKSTNVLDQSEGRIRLQRLSQNDANPMVQAQARQQLVVDAMNHKDYAAALAVSQQLVTAPNASFENQLLRLSVLKDTTNSAFLPTLKQYQTEAGTNLAKISGLSKWMIQRDAYAATLSWLRTLPPYLETNNVIMQTAADCHLGMRDWRGLQAAIQNQNWGDLEYARHAYLARALRGVALDSAAKAEWSAAIQYASDLKRSTAWQRQAKIWLFTHAVQWKWNNERDDLLWALVNEYPELKWAPLLLKPTLIAGGRTRPLMQLLSIMSQRAPNDISLKNDLAMTAMLLGAAEVKPYDMASSVYQKDPKNPAYASTYAFALYQQKKYAEGLNVMQQLTPQQLSQPGIAGYYGLILKATGHAAEAKSYFAIAAKSTLLPEEKRLFDSAAGN